MTLITLDLHFKGDVIGNRKFTNVSLFFPVCSVRAPLSMPVRSCNTPLCTVGGPQSAPPVRIYSVGVPLPAPSVRSLTAPPVRSGSVGVSQPALLRRSSSACSVTKDLLRRSFSACSASARSASKDLLRRSSSACSVTKVLLRWSASLY